MAYDPHVVNAILRIGKRRGMSREAMLGALSTGIVESGLQDLEGGDRDSYGFRQQRESIYGRDNLQTQINNFFDEWEQFDKPGFNPGQTAANVQRPAEQYRGRYAQHIAEAKKLLAGQGFHGGGGQAPEAVMATPEGANIFETLANFNQNTLDQSNPMNQTLQQGWDLLAQLSGNKGQPVQTGASAILPGKGKPGAIRRGLHEAFYDPVGGYDEGKNIGAIGGHGDHAHFGGNPAAIAAIVRRAQRNNLTVREYAPVDPVDPVHTEGSWHDRYGGRGAADISGDPDALAAFFRRITRRAGLR